MKCASAQVIHKIGLYEVPGTHFVEFRTYNKFGKLTTFIGNASDGGGYLRTNNKFETETVFLGTNNANEGLINLNDKFGQSFWIRLNKKN